MTEELPNYITRGDVLDALDNLMDLTGDLVIRQTLQEAIDHIEMGRCQ